MLQERLQTIFKVVGVILIFCIVGVGILCLDRILTPEKSPAETFEEAREKLMSAEFDGRMYMRKNVVTYMIAGVDKTEGEEATASRFMNYKNADFILLLVIDKSNREISAINVNRDTVTKMDVLGRRDDGTVGAINQIVQPITLAHTYGDGKQESAENLRRAVSELFLKIKIDHYLTMTMDAVGTFTDYVGGVPVTLKEDEDLHDAAHPDWLPGATVQLTGKDALDFLRDRDTEADGSNVERMDRQNRYIQSLAQVISGKKWDKKYLMGAYDAIGEFTCTDHTNVDDLYDELQQMFAAFGMFTYGDIIKIAPAEKNNDPSYGHYGVFNYKGEEKDGFYIGYTYDKNDVDEEKKLEDDEAEKKAFKKMVVDTFYRQITDKETK